MFGVSITELVVVFVVALLLFGPDKLPEIARTLGKLSGELKKGTDSLRREFYNSVYKPIDEVKHDVRAVGRDLKTEATVKTKVEELSKDLPK